MRLDIFFVEQLLNSESKLLLSFENVGGRDILSDFASFKPFMHNIPKWSDTLLKFCSICCKIFKVSEILLRIFLQFPKKPFLKASINDLLDHSVTSFYLLL